MRRADRKEVRCRDTGHSHRQRIAVVHPHPVGARYRSVDQAGKRTQDLGRGGLKTEEFEVGRDLLEPHVRAHLERAATGLHGAQEGWRGWSTKRSKTLFSAGQHPRANTRLASRTERRDDYGDGETTRDFCYVANVVQANLLAATVDDKAALGLIYNVAVGGRMSLNELYGTMREITLERHPGLRIPEAIHEDFRPGDVRHSQADISKARRLLGYRPTHDTRSGLRESLPWYEALRAGGLGKSAPLIEDVRGAA
jgi:hypothetical protein